MANAVQIDNWPIEPVNRGTQMRSRNRRPAGEMQPPACVSRVCIRQVWIAPGKPLVFYTCVRARCFGFTANVATPYRMKYWYIHCSIVP